MPDISTSEGYEVDTNAKHNFLTTDGVLTTPTGERFWLTHRSWNETNLMLGELPGLAIDYKLSTIPPQQEVVVLDLGAGSRGVAMHELQQKFTNPNSQSRVRVTGVDLTHNYSIEAPDNKLMANVTQLPLRDNSVDVAYSSQTLALLADRAVPKKEEVNAIQQGINESVRVLKPGGVFLIDLDIPYYRNLLARYQLSTLVLPEGVTAYWGHQGPRNVEPIGNFLLTAIVKNDPVNGTDGLVRKLDLQSERRINP